MSEAHKATYLPSTTDRKRRVAAFVARRIRGVVTYGKVLVVPTPPGMEAIPQPAVRRPPRRGGSLRGRIRMADDFDELPPDVLAAMLGDED